MNRDERPRPPSFPAFEPRAPWWGPDLQTLRNVLVGGPRTSPAEQSDGITLPLLDGSGDVLHASIDVPEDTGRAAKLPTVVLIHGLSGTGESAYMLASRDFHLRRGHRVVRMNLRGAGASRATCRTQYHAGRSEDLDEALRGLPTAWREAGLLLVGYSLGGNMLLKFTAQYASRHPVVAAASVSAPIDLAAASRRFLDRRNWFYHRHLLRNMKLECFAAPEPPSDAERRAIESSRSILEFDERVVAPRNGFDGAEHYYAVNHARQYLASIEHPTLVVHALDDPWIPADAYTSYDWSQNPELVPVLSRGGGHVGFHARGDTDAFHDQCIGRFIDHVLEAESPGTP
ncbi:MAG: alpha/beta fold hydrolase [Myxococcota bacterium]|jgi:hypothetical protein|nr:alpha/beta fold hydrolase [Myxococcota bacterium]